jgi:hypothetical protein
MAGLEDRQVKIYFDDLGKVLIKEGVFLCDDGAYTQIKTFRGIEAIPTIKVIRVEVIR